MRMHFIGFLLWRRGKELNVAGQSVIVVLDWHSTGIPRKPYQKLCSISVLLLSEKEYKTMKRPRISFLFELDFAGAKQESERKNETVAGCF